MKPEEQRIAIAIACGWQKTHPNQEKSWWFKPRENARDVVPDYPQDLNACRGMIKFLQERDYSCILTWSENKCECYFIKGESKQAGVSLSVIGDDICKVICEAFLKTLGLWKEAV